MLAYVTNPSTRGYTKSTNKGGGMKAVDYIAWVLVIIGGLNWGLVGLFDYNLVDGLFGEGSALARIIYSLVGLAAVYVAVKLAMKGGDDSARTVKAS